MATPGTAAGDCLWSNGPGASRLYATARCWPSLFSISASASNPGARRDAAGSEKPAGNAQNRETLLGKILRIDVENAGEQAYAIPSDNPFVGQAGRDEIWVYGLRNPWRFSFDRANADLYIGDVGQSAQEEINYAPAGSSGQNYGWNIMEGEACYNAETCEQQGLTLPVQTYAHQPVNCSGSVTGGYVYRGTAFPGLVGRYFYADYCTGRLWSLRMQDEAAVDNQLLLETGRSIAGFGEDEAGELYLVDLSGGSIARIVDPAVPEFSETYYLPFVQLDS